MSILGEKCAVCGEKRTRREYDGKHVCAHCHLETLLKQEQVRNCPVDGSPMKKEVMVIAIELIVDWCPSCEGIWLDKGELELLGDWYKRGGGASDYFLPFRH